MTNENPDQDEDEDEEQETIVQEGIVMKRRKRRRKYSSADEDYLDREESKRRLAQEVGVSEYTCLRSSYGSHP